jgi:hypothetical protein
VARGAGELRCGAADVSGSSRAADPVPRRDTDFGEDGRMSSDQGTLDAGTPAESVLESATARRFVTALRTLEEDG